METVERSAHAEDIYNGNDHDVVMEMSLCLFLIVSLLCLGGYDGSEGPFRQIYE